MPMGSFLSTASRSVGGWFGGSKSRSTSPKDASRGSTSAASRALSADATDTAVSRDALPMAFATQSNANLSASLGTVGGETRAPTGTAMPCATLSSATASNGLTADDTVSKAQPVATDQTSPAAMRAIRSRRDVQDPQLSKETVESLRDTARSSKQVQTVQTDFLKVYEALSGVEDKIRSYLLIKDDVADTEYAKHVPVGTYRAEFEAQLVAARKAAQEELTAGILAEEAAEDDRTQVVGRDGV
ncbi:hypothetical protein I316_07722 [Kwoniella heveanensis BCC8398]|uniref:Uncharacterized protein n=1 Tax=Kwoniella heveanensis BCC8398 TaxID=1296120 RepID=A0A1B9GHP6_9TREE|nr:hypothetical protein I316_07722 [Kwoniella heveanensis BCC8398]